MAMQSRPLRTGQTTADLHNQTPFYLPPDTRLQGGRYVVLANLGKGGMGHVYRVRDTHLGLDRALKEMLPRFDDPRAKVVNFQREMDIMKALRHPGIPQIYDAFDEYQRSYLVMDFIDGLDLEQLIQREDDPFPEELVGDWVLQLCEIMEYLHAHTPPIVFRDMKPSNVILERSKRIVLIDFGIAREFRGEFDQTLVGTNGYAAPEQYHGHAEPRTDIYAMGAMMHHLLTKVDPKKQTPLSFAERPLRMLNPTISPEIEAVVNRCLEHDIERRYQSVAELRTALREALYGSGYASQPSYGGYANGGPWAGGASPMRPTPAYATPVGMQRPSVLWQFHTEDEIRATPLVADGTCYVGSYDNNLYALDARGGHFRWKFATEGGICGTPAVWNDLLIFGSEDFNVYAVDRANHQEAWRYRTWNHVRSSPRIYDDRLYIGSDDGHLHALNPRSGHPYWKFETFREVRSSAAYADRTVFVGSCDEMLYAIDALTGQRKWSFRTSERIVSSPAVADGHVYVGSFDFGIYAVEAKSGWQEWCERTEKFIFSSPCVVGDRLYVGSADMHVYCLDRQRGTVLWKVRTQGRVNSTPVHADGVIYVGSNDERIYALDALTGKQRWVFETGGIVPGSACVCDGVVYIGSADGNLYALRGDL